MTPDPHDALHAVDVNAIDDHAAPPSQSTPCPKRDSIQNPRPTADDAITKIDAEPRASSEDASEAVKRARDDAARASAPQGKRSKASAHERAPREMDLDALPETLREWKTSAERELGELWTKQRLRLLDWFEVKLAINKCIVSCPAGDLREKMRALRHNGVLGNSMVPYLQLLRDLFDETDQYKDNLDEELNFSDFFDEDEDEDEDEEDEDEDEEDENEVQIPQIARARAEPAAEPTKTANKNGASRSAPSVEEMDELRVKFSKFTQFLGQYFSENRLENENVVEIVEHASNAGFDDAQEVNKFLEIMQKRNMILYDQEEWRVYIL